MGRKALANGIDIIVGAVTVPVSKNITKSVSNALNKPAPSNTTVASNAVIKNPTANNPEYNRH